MPTVLITGHKNPDTDSITSALVYAYYKKQQGVDALPVRLGEVNKETQYALDTFEVEAPRLVNKELTAGVEEIILVDHNERQQSMDGVEDFKVVEVIDHHRIANFETLDPLYYRAEPVGCTATILLKLFKEQKIEIPKEMAGLMLSAIISDSLLFKSPTCTEEDMSAAKELEQIAGVDAETYGLEMLKAGADLSDKSGSDLISLDAKEFEAEGHKLEIAQINTVDVDDVLRHKPTVMEEMKAVIEARNLSVFLFVITDILNNDSTIIAAGENAKKVERAFDVQLDNDQALLKGVVSRKKQIAPVLIKEFS